ncbi:MAG: Hint domain-containing protein [Maritimibacter sp.]|nr:Hint domain-containing protein [Maritimibacter sp.]
MSWIALTDLSNPAFNIRGIGVPRNAPRARGPMERHEILPRGSMVIEFRANVKPDRPLALLTFQRDFEWLRELRVGVEASGRVTVEVGQGQAQSLAVVDMPPPPREARMRLTYAWHAPQRVSRLTVELIDEGRIYQANGYDPLPLPAADAKAIVRNGRATAISKNVDYIAFSDEIEPIGFGNGIVTGTPVETTGGPVPVEKLRLGDMVVTATAGPQPVRWIGKRRVPALGGFCPVRVRAPFFGLSRDIVLSPAHRVRLGVAEAEYMLGEDEVLMPAGRLVDGRHALGETRHRLVTYHQILLDVHDCLLHDGLWAESLFAGTIVRQPEMVQSTVLAEMPISAIPVHRAFSRTRLTDFETRNLVAAFATG